MWIAKDVVDEYIRGSSKTIRPLVGDGRLDQEIHISVAGVYKAGSRRARNLGELQL
jgi:hypothetical protein